VERSYFVCSWRTATWCFDPFEFLFQNADMSNMKMGISVFLEFLVSGTQE
jgi:hypothetical protein